MPRRPGLVLRAAILLLSLVPLAPRHAVSADAAAKLETQAVRIKLDPENVRWNWTGRRFAAAVKYCAWLSKHTGRKFRLPSEAEWEYACRAGGPPFAPKAADLDAVAWFAGNSSDTPDVPGYEAPHAVGRRRPNAWGLYDMLGNVGEYVVRDRKDERGLLAGGSYTDAATGVHSGAREAYSPDWEKNDPEDPKRADWLDYGGVHHAGFRVVMEE